MKPSSSAAIVLILLGAGVASAEPPAEPPAAPVPGPQAGYAKGFFIHGDDPDAFSLRINGRVQTRLEAISADTGDGRDQDAAFSVSRARVKLSGRAHSEAIRYLFEADFGKGFVTLKDYVIDYDAGPVQLRAGQWKRPFSRQQLNSSGKLEFIERAITDSYFSTGRDIGLAIHNDYLSSPDGIGWVVGLFNGTGDKPRFTGSGVLVDPVTGEVEIDGGGFSNVPDTLAPAIVARADLNQRGIKGFSEADLEGGPLRWSVGASVMAELDGDSDDDSSVRAELDYIVKAQGFSTTGGIYAATVQDDTRFVDQTYAATGFHVQAGYVIGDTYQPAVRYALIVPDEGDELHELRVGFSIYAFSHKFKWQTDAGVLAAGSLATDQVVQARSQLQLAF
jgi:hypothetical protein